MRVPLATSLVNCRNSGFSVDARCACRRDPPGPVFSYGKEPDVLAFGRANPYLLRMKKRYAILVTVLLLPGAVLLAGGQ